MSDRTGAGAAMECYLGALMDERKGFIEFGEQCAKQGQISYQQFVLMAAGVRLHSDTARPGALKYVTQPMADGIVQLDEVLEKLHNSYGTSLVRLAYPGIKLEDDRHAGTLKELTYGRANRALGSDILRFSVEKWTESRSLYNRENLLLRAELDLEVPTINEQGQLGFYEPATSFPVGEVAIRYIRNDAREVICSVAEVAIGNKEVVGQSLEGDASRLESLFIADQNSIRRIR